MYWLGKLWIATSGCALLAMTEKRKVEPQKKGKEYGLPRNDRKKEGQAPKEKEWIVVQ